MKVALVILHANPRRGGAERYTIDLAAALARRGIGVRVISATFAHEVPQERRIPLDARAPTRAGRYRKFLNRLDEYLAAEPFDVVHAMLPVRRCDVYHPHAGMAVEAARKWNVLFNPRRRAMAAVERRLLTGSRGGALPPIVISLSEYVKRDILRHYPSLPLDRLATLFNAVDLERFAPPPEHPPRPEVRGLIIANDFARKGVAEAIMALEKANDRRLNLHVVGRGDVTQYNEVSHRPIVFHGPVDDPRPFYASADFFVLPTKHDPCSLVVLEALAMGLPVISTKFNGACEIMSDGVHGYVLDDPRDIGALAEAMREMLEPDRRAAMRAACLALRPQLSYEHHLERLLGIYQSVIDSRAARR